MFCETKFFTILKLQPMISASTRAGLKIFTPPQLFSCPASSLVITLTKPLAHWLSLLRIQQVNSWLYKALE
jgi:hypothetical protein